MQTAFQLKPKLCFRLAQASLCATMLLAVVVLPASSYAQVPAANDAFGAAWSRLDQPVAQGRVQRSWVWGPKALDTRSEPLEGSPGGSRQVQYYDKSRMEVNNPAADPRSPWYVTNGLLVYEMLSGRVQVGTDKFEQRQPARIPVAGEAPPAASPANLTASYEMLAKVATLSGTQNAATARTGQPVNELISAEGTVTAAPPQGVGSIPRLQQFEKATAHNIPDVFWTFMNQRGLVYSDGQYRQDRLLDWVYTMGYPLTEPYWVQTYIAGKQAYVMVQAFQRRILTYNPANAPEWRVEMGNVGMQYHQWRYGQQGAAQPTPPAGGAKLDIRRVDLTSLFEPRQYSAIREPLYTGAGTLTEWQALWERHVAELDSINPPPRVNFDTEFVVAAFWGDRPNGCYHLDIESVIAAGSELRVVVNQYARGEVCTEAITRPFDIVAVSKARLTDTKYSLVYMDSTGKELARTGLTLP